MNPLRILGLTAAGAIGAVYGWRSERADLERARQPTEEFTPVVLTVVTSDGDRRRKLA